MRVLPPAGAALRDAIQAINQLIAGRSNACGEVTLTPGVTTTTIVGPNVNENGFVFLYPQTASAAAKNTTTFASITRISGTPTVTITHANTAEIDRKFSYVVLGG